jgi:hypothetical protein
MTEDPDGKSSKKTLPHVKKPEKMTFTTIAVA